MAQKWELEKGSPRIWDHFSQKTALPILSLILMNSRRKISYTRNSASSSSLRMERECLHVLSFYQRILIRFLESFLCMDEEQLWRLYHPGQDEICYVRSRRSQLSSLSGCLDRMLLIQLICFVEG